MCGLPRAQYPQLSQECHWLDGLSPSNGRFRICTSKSAGKPLTWGYDYSQQATLMNVWNRTESLSCEDFPVYNFQSYLLELDISARGLQDQIFRGNSIRLFCNLSCSPTFSTCLCININWGHETYLMQVLVFSHLFCTFILNVLLLNYSH